MKKLTVNIGYSESILLHCSFTINRMDCIPNLKQFFRKRMRRITTSI
jgi:hypothetical protein